MVNYKINDIFRDCFGKGYEYKIVAIDESTIFYIPVIQKTTQEMHVIKKRFEEHVALGVWKINIQNVIPVQETFIDNIFIL